MSIKLGRDNAQQAGVANRVKFDVLGASKSLAGGCYDLVVVIEAIHDMSQPVEALRNIRSSLAPGGIAIVADEKVGDSFSLEADDFEKMCYGASILLCLPNGMAEKPSAAAGTIMRRSTMERYAASAGFKKVDVLEIDHSWIRFYRLLP